MLADAVSVQSDGALRYELRRQDARRSIALPVFWGHRATGRASMGDCAVVLRDVGVNRGGVSEAVLQNNAAGTSFRAAGEPERALLFSDKLRTWG
jgi:hypothetical protein